MKTYDIMLWNGKSSDRFFQVNGKRALRAAVIAHGCNYDGFASSFYSADPSDGRWVEVYGIAK